MEKLTGKGKHIVKVQNHTHKNMISKPSAVRRAQMQDTRHTFEMKRPATSNNLVYIIFLNETLFHHYNWSLTWASFSFPELHVKLCV